MHISLMCASEPSEHVPYPNLLLCLPLERPRVLTAHHTYSAQVKEDVCLLSGLWPSASLCRLTYLLGVSWAARLDQVGLLSPGEDFLPVRWPGSHIPMSAGPGCFKWWGKLQPCDFQGREARGWQEYPYQRGILAPARDETQVENCSITGWLLGKRGENERIYHFQI